MGLHGLLQGQLYRYLYYVIWANCMVGTTNCLEADFSDVRGYDSMHGSVGKASGCIREVPGSNRIQDTYYCD
jgi:hypothetical protein